jgi:hypothetical protein
MWSTAGWISRQSSGSRRTAETRPETRRLGPPGKGVFIVIRACLIAFGLLVFGCVGVSEASAATCPEHAHQWTGAAGNGSWNTAGNWNPAEVPRGGSDVCLLDIGHSYTVTLAPSGESAGGTWNTLTIGTPTGSDTETLDIVGESWVYQGETQHGEGIGVSNGATINATGSLVLDATAGGSRVGSETPGGGAGFGDSPFGGGATIYNYGKIIAESSDYPAYGEELNGVVDNEPGGSITVASGSLDQKTSNTITNSGTVTTDPGGDYDVTSAGSNDIFNNDGTVTNNGTFEVGGQTGTFTQNGPETGNPVLIEAGSALADQSGTGAFTIEFTTNVLTGTIPAGQTVTVDGASNVYQGETQNSTNLNLDGGTVTNDGTLVLDATTGGTAVPGETLGGSVALFNGSLTNNGTLDVKVDDPTWKTTLNANVTNSHTGTTTIAGVVNQAEGVNGITFTNEGTLTLTPTTLWNLYGGATFTNAADGTLIPQIAGASSFGTLSVGGTMTAAGTIAPSLTGGYTPPVGQEFDVIRTGGSNFTGNFTGTFGAVSSGFVADYSHETANPPYVGVVYGSPPGGGGTPAPGSLTIGAAAKVARDGVAGVTLTCSGAKGATCAGLLKITVRVRTRVTRRVKGHRRTVTDLTTVKLGSATYTLPAGQSETLRIKLSASGVRRLDAASDHRLKATATATESTGGRNVTRSVTLTGPRPRSKTKK